METTLNTFKSFYLLPEYVGRLESRIAPLNKRADKLGLTRIQMVVTDDYIQVIDSQAKKFRVNLLSAPVVISGWRVVGVISILDNGEALLTGNVPEEYRNHANTCDHCGQNRARKVTVLLQDGEGNLKQVGRACLKDFTDTTNPEKLADWYQDILEIEIEDDEGSEFEGGGTRVTHFDTLRVLAVAAAVIRIDSRYVPTSAVNDSVPSISTAYKVRSIVEGKGTFEVTEEDSSKASRVIVWGRGKTGESGYLGNVAAALAGPVLEYRTFGIAVSAVAAYYRSEREAADDIRRAENPSVHFGTVGRRESFRLKPVFRTVTENDYGYKTVLAFVDTAGNRATWFASGIVDSPEVDSEGFATCKATVKSHGEYKGELQTIISRVKF